MRPRSMLALVAAVPLSLLIAACGSSSSSTSSSSGGSSSGAALTGAGSTFAAPIYMQWGSNLAGQGVSINYQAVGSGTGIADLIAKTVDFGATDPPMKASEIAAAAKNGTVVHFPTALGAITVAYNLPGVATGLKLDGQTIANMYLGTIKTWNDPAIAKLNPGVSLPSTAIAPVYRSDSSGTTKGFTGFLAAVDPTWAKQVGSDKTVKWPTGTGAKGNSGVAGAVKQTTGAVGYVEQAYALQNQFTVAAVKNKAGKYVAPTLASTTAAGTGLSVPASLQFTISNPSNPAAYPITSQTFIVVYQDLCKAGLSQSKAQAMVKFLKYGLGPAGQGVLKQLQYAPLPASIDHKALAKIAILQCNGSPVP